MLASDSNYKFMLKGRKHVHTSRLGDGAMIVAVVLDAVDIPNASA